MGQCSLPSSAAISTHRPSLRGLSLTHMVDKQFIRVSCGWRKILLSSPGQQSCCLFVLLSHVSFLLPQTHCQLPEITLSLQIMTLHKNISTKYDFSADKNIQFFH
ncbi:hypothetical protein CHARACLAT_006454 [Characodon lateralis]|uniref:Uncharacterized protein n=1 Tax=Characodon lateralis TaxID=208331 RepID=A0ABU7E7I7_9TELE|nr:hypothetical protein [Characodon lateralis]